MPLDNLRDWIGKTQTAAEYAYRYRDEYDTVLWLRATPEHFASDVLRIATLVSCRLF